MPTATSNRAVIPLSALHEILRWAENRSVWQRDALRRIIVSGGIDEAGLEDLERLCRHDHKADSSKAALPTAEPLAAKHLPPGPGTQASVALTSIGKLDGVNKLPSDQVLTFGSSPGLTVIFGNNGSGKSGYARVIKRACRSRGAPPVIRPNVYSAAPTKPASGEIVFQAGAVSQTLSWSEGGAGDARLANVFVFDASTAKNYLDEDGPASFTPYGLDVLPKLAKTCDDINARIQKDIDQTNTAIAQAAKDWKPIATTAVGKLLSGLSDKTQPQDVERLAAIRPEDSQRLVEVTEALKADPKQKAKETRAAASRINTFAESLSTVATAITDDESKLVKDAIETAKRTADAARLFASGFFDGSFLAGTGDDLWRTLWQAAREYSAGAAYTGQEPPVIEDGKCVLCQRDIDEEAATRLRKFDEFTKNQSQQLAAKAAGDLSLRKNSLVRLLSLSPELKKLDADLSILDAEQREKIVLFSTAADAKVNHLKNCVESGNWMEPETLPPSPLAILQDGLSRLDARALMEESADKPEERAKLQAERDELAARVWLNGVKAAVLDQFQRFKTVTALKACQGDLSTNTITRKSTELTESLVTEAFCKRFLAEVGLLGLRTLAAKLECIKGRKGETRFGVRLDGATHSLSEVASEGEQRCVSLAAFLAELSQSSHHSALVFDDPVSSLDHWHRECIAVRLVKEANTRQVIVFTHDAVFLHDLETHAEKDGVVAAFRFLEWQGNQPGRCQDGLPWDFKSAKDRLDKLEKDQRKLAKAWGPQPTELNVSEMRRAYSQLRSTVECVVEKVVFAGVVFRFRSYINFKSLDDAVGFTDHECGEINRIFGRCCDVTDAHSPAAGKQAPVPDPSDLAKDIADTGTLIEAIKKRQSTKRSAAAAPKVAAAGGS